MLTRTNVAAGQLTILNLHARFTWFGVYGVFNPSSPKGQRVLVSALVEFFPTCLEPESLKRAERVNTTGALEP